MHWIEFAPRSKRRFVWRFLWVIAGIVCALSVNDAPAHAESNEATAVRTAFGLEYAVPGGPRNLVAEAPGRIWYTSTDGGGIGFLEVISDTEVITGTTQPIVRYRTEFYGIGRNSQPYDLDYHDGVVWFTLHGVRSLGKIDVTTREIEIFPLLTVGAAPTALDVDPTGQVWIGQNNGRISRFDPATEEFTEYLLPDNLRLTPRIEDLVYQNPRNIWFTMPDANRVIQYDSIRDRFSEIPSDDPGPMGISIDNEGQLWITTLGSSQVARFSPTTISIWISYKTPNPDGGPVGLLVFNDAENVRQVWMTENRTGTIGRLQIADGFELTNSEALRPATPPGNTWGIMRAPDAHIWVTDISRNVLYELTEPYIHRTYMATISQSHVPDNQAQQN